jgi:general secretion pathway protein J
MSCQRTCTSLAHRGRAAWSTPEGLPKLRRCSSGMTLIEVLAALAIFALLAAVLLLASRLADHSYRSVVRLNRSSWRVLASQRFLRRILQSAYPFEPAPGTSEHGIDGTASTLAVTAPMPMAAESMGFYRYVFALQKRPDGLDNLIVRMALDRDGTSSPSSLAGSGGLPKEILLARIESARWSYLAPHTDSLDATAQSTWINAWHRTTPPLLIRLRVRFPPKDARVWPEFLVHPRITDDAQCQFDAIAQVCRRGRR